ncbi:MAG: hypothetical protein E7267_06725 [Lachnospiraceae bacterium]|nr:hypothetical protein [Lachnospiraceae bacterium]
MGGNSWMDHPAYTDMNPAKKLIIEELISKTAGKGINETANLIMTTMTLMRNNNVSFTKEEADLLINVMMRDMNDSEKAKLNLMKSMIASGMAGKK